MGPFQISQRKGLNVTPKRMDNTAKAIMNDPPIAAIHVFSLQAATDMVRLAFSLPDWILAIFFRWL